jgi:hypothetical protein
MTAEAADSYPTGRGRWLPVARAAWLGLVGLLVGLYLFSLPSQIALRETLCSGSACPYSQISPNDLRLLQQAGISLHANAVYFAVVNSLFVLVFLVVSLIIFWRRSNEGIALFASLALVVFSVSFNSPLETLGAHYPMLLLPAQLVDTFGGASMGLLFLVFPNGRFVPRGSIVLAPLLILRAVLRIFAPAWLGGDYEFPVLLGLLVCAQIYRYARVSNAIERQQTKWTLAGMSVGVAGFAGLLIWAVLSSGGRPAGVANLIGNTGLYLCLGLIPLSIGMAILRSHLWDIDLLIRRTLLYSALTGLLALVYGVAVVVLQNLFTLLTPPSGAPAGAAGAGRSELVTVLSTLAIAALFVPLRTRLQTWIDRRFYRRKYDTQLVLASFAAAVRNEMDLNTLSEQLLGVIDETMHPVDVALWLMPSGGANGEAATQPGQVVTVLAN